MGAELIVPKLLEYGVLGIAVFFLTLALIRKDKQVTALYIRLVEKSERGEQKYQELAEALDDTLKEMSDVIQMQRVINKKVEEKEAKHVQLVDQINVR
jgi:hypothetical protein